ncbi:hypothetical protein JCM33374_g4905 [Metschnikowia sp. JCM 33374]|nr:hypothetical protein JCM33374_g4905 [Metschnikowia sp. JCM 33374]
MSALLRVLNPQFHGRNLVAYNFAALACIAFAVFLSASQPFYLANVIGISPDKVGKVTGSLGVVDELTAIVMAPLIGTLNDRLQGIAWKSSRMPSGPRIIELGGFAALALALFGHGKIASHVVPDLYVLRSFFAVGITSVMGISVVMLHEASNSDFTWQKLKFWARKRSQDERTLDELHEDDRTDEIAADEDQLFVEEGDAVYSQKRKRYHGKLSALLGMCSGSGALLAVVFFIPLPARLGQSHQSWSTAECIQISYVILGGLALIAGAIVYALGYDSIKQRKLAQTSLAAETPDATYLELLKEAVHVSLHSRKIQLAYLGGFIARSTAIATTVFTPLMVYKYYSATGSCGKVPPGIPGMPGSDADAPQARADPPSPSDCFNAFIFSAILTGVASTMSLLSTPVWSIVVDSPRMGSSFALFAGSVMSILGCFGLCIAGAGAEVYDPRNVWCFVALSLVGIAQMGAIIASMSLVSKAGQSLEDSEHRVIGSISGLYNLCGSVGILIVSKVGGTWSDHWVFGPFFVLGLLNLALMVFAGLSLRRVK